MPNKQPKVENLIPLSKRSDADVKRITSMGGVASGEARRKRADRKARIRELMSIMVKDKSILDDLDKYIDTDNGIDLETAMDMRQIIKAIKKADTYAYQTLKDEAYGKMKQEVEQTIIEPPVPLSPRKQKN